MAGYAPADVDLLSAIRSDILNRPEAYAEGRSYLEQQYGPEALYKHALADWKKWKDDPTQQASDRATAELIVGIEKKERTSLRGTAQLIRGVVKPAQRKARRSEILEQLSAPPKTEDFTFAVCASRAIQGLMDAMANEYHAAKAQAVLLLAVMLWDAGADKRHPIFALFGPWGAGPDGSGDLNGRCLATYFVDKKADRRRWMHTVRVAAKAMPRPRDDEADALADAKPQAPTAEANAERTSATNGPAANPPRKGTATVKELVEEWSVPGEAARKALDRWRQKHAGGDGYTEVSDRRPREPKYLYDRAKVCHVMEAMKDRQTRSEIRRTKTSGERPSTKT
jgi:hypothetical protein